MLKIYQKSRLEVAYPNLVRGNILVIISIILLIPLSCNKRYEPEKIIIPNDYTGFIFIVYDQDGYSKEKEFGYRIYKIPQSGLLFTSHKPNWGVTSLNLNDVICYYYDSSYVPIRKLPVYSFPTEHFLNIYQDSIVVFPLGLHGVGKYYVYPLYVDTLKHFNDYSLGNTPISEAFIDSLLKKQ